MLYIAEIGLVTLIIAFILSLLLAVVPLTGVALNAPQLMRLARPLAYGQMLFVTLSFSVLLYAFLVDDFSLAIVASQSNSLLPTLYKVTALWGGHEGSLLLWALILALWTSAVALFSRSLPLDMVARVLSVMGMIAVGFTSFSLFTSSPFIRNLPTIPADGADLNPLLQDIAMAIHPPMLYLGYVGFSVAFAFAIAALMSGRLDAAWAKWSRPWTNLAWAFLTAGITLGSWWAYYELGWGGWWFWDPVENASFMPWIVGTALVHSLAVTEKRGVFKSWTVLLAIFAFSLSLLGTFLVRSGVITSVHAFATDPSRGLFILGFLLVVVGGSLTLYALRAPTVSSRVSFGWLSRETGLLLNNVILLIVCMAILICTLFPLIMDALGAGKYSVGPPVFNAVFVPFIACLMALMGFGPLLKWKNNELGSLFKKLSAAGIAAIVIGLIFPFAYAGEFNIAIVIAVCLSVWIAGSLITDLRTKLRNASSVLSGLKRLKPSYYGMVLAHLGIAVCCIGVSLDSHYRDERDVRMNFGESLTVASETVRFDSVDDVRGANYSAKRGIFTINPDADDSFVLTAEKRRYFAKGSIMTEAGIDAGITRDLFIALGEELKGDSWSVRIHYKPFVRWIWMGGLLMFLGGLITVFDKRYRNRATAA